MHTMSGDFHLPDDWRDLSIEGLRDTLMIVGAPDVGKSTFARYLFEGLQARSRSVGLLDGDPGQSALGTPATITLSLSKGDGPSFPPGGRIWRRFIGATSPAGHMLSVLVGAARLVEAAYAAGAEAIVYDTSGLIDPSQGGYALKLAKVDLLQPSQFFVLQRESELESLLQSLEQSDRVPVTKLRPSPRARRRKQAERQRYRARKFASYFSDAPIHDIAWRSKAVIPTPTFDPGRLLAFEDRNGFTLELGLVKGIRRGSDRLSVMTPLGSMEQVVHIHVGDLVLDLETYRDHITRVMWT
jgi:polynucleotide 5'-hydroxyl-kinase GRC3/NOL9